MPLLDNYVPGLYYDLTINATVYADEPEVTVLPAAVSFVPGPILASVVPCINTLAADSTMYPKCHPGQPLTIVGTGFLPVDPAVWISIVGEGFSGACVNVSVLDNEHVVCVLPEPGLVESRQYGIAHAVRERQHIIVACIVPVRRAAAGQHHIAQRL